VVYAVVAISITALAVIGIVVGLCIFLARELKENRVDLAAYHVANGDLTKKNVELNARVTTLTLNLDAADLTTADVREQLQRELVARRFAEDSMKKLVVQLAENADTSTLQEVVVQNLKRLDEIRRPVNLPLPSPPVHRPTPPETPSAKLTPVPGKKP
jgi:hypothetical protein